MKHINGIFFWLNNRPYNFCLKFSELEYFCMLLYNFISYVELSETKMLFPPLFKSLLM